jgi:hypothetical protein
MVSLVRMIACGSPGLPQSVSVPVQASALLVLGFSHDLDMLADCEKAATGDKSSAAVLVI